MIELQKPTERYTSALSFNIRILQIIEKHKLSARIGRGEDFSLQGESLNFYNTDTTNNRMVLAINLPITKEEIRTGTNFAGSPLNDFLNIENIFDDPITEVINVEKYGDSFKAERFHKMESLDKINFNLVDKETFNLNQYDYRNRRKYFAFDGVETKDQIVLYISFDPYFLLFNNTEYYYKDEYLFKLPVHVKDNNLFDIYQQITKNRNHLDVKIMMLYSFYSLYELSKKHDLGLDGSFKDYIGFETTHGSQVAFLKTSGVTLKTKQDLSKNIIDTILIELVNNPEDHHTIKAYSNNINPLDFRTYSSFLFKNKTENKIDSLHAFDILPETEQVSDILEIKKIIPCSNFYKVIRSCLFITDDNKEHMQELYHNWVKESSDTLFKKWNSIIDRINRSGNIGFVSKIELALMFIKKHIWPYFQFSNQTTAGNVKIPYLFSFLIDQLSIDVATFFGIQGYESYFNDMSKASAVISQLKIQDNRYEELYNLKDNNSYSIERNLYFTQPQVQDATVKQKPNYYYNNKTHIIINDSYMKQAWKPKIKKFAADNIDKNGTLVYVLTTANKLETLVLKRVLKDRALVYQYSNFISGVNIKPAEKKPQTTKIMTLNLRNVHEINKRLHWNLVNNITLLPDHLFVPYSTKKGIRFNGQYYSPRQYEDRWVKWVERMATLFNKKIALISERDLAKVEKEQQVPKLEEFLDSDIFKAKINIIVNEKLLVPNYNVHRKLIDFISIFQNQFIEPIYSNAGTHNSKTAEHIFYKTIDMIQTPELRNTLTKLLPYFPIKTKYYRYQFTKFIQILPPADAFDYHIFQKMIPNIETTFTEDELNEVELFIKRAGNTSYNRSNTNQALNTMLNSTSSLLSKSNDINLNKEEQNKILDSVVNIYLLDLLKFIKLT